MDTAMVPPLQESHQARRMVRKKSFFHDLGILFIIPVGSYDYEDEGPPTPKAGISGSHISATPGSEEVLDPRESS